MHAVPDHRLPAGAKRLAAVVVAILLVSAVTGSARAAAGRSAEPAGVALLDGARSSNPHAPSYGHPYRYAAVPTRQSQAQMQAYRARHPFPAAAVSGDGLLHYGGGPVVSGQPRVYLVFWGSGWGVFHYDARGDHTFTRDPFAGAPKLQELFKGLGSGGELWSGVLNQYCQGVATGATTCAPSAAHVPYPSGGALAGVLYDDITVPVNATANQIANEAVRSAQIFGNLTALANHDAQYVILSPTGYHPDEFGTAPFCAWHGAATCPYGPVAFTNLPYVMDLGAQCGMGLINGSAGALDGYTIDAGHEYAETLTDPLPTSGWTDPALGNEGENADKYTPPPILIGRRVPVNVSTATGTFVLPATWSNDTLGCETSHGVVPVRTVVPAVIGDGPTQAGQDLTAAGLVRGGITNVVDCGSLGLVVDQRPIAGSVVPIGTAVALTAGTNPRPSLHCQ
jgi:hypothetical protein